MNKIASYKIYLDVRTKRKKDNRHPVKLRVTFNRKQKYYTTKFVLTQKEFDSLPQAKDNTVLSEINEALNEIKKSARNAIIKLPEFSFDLFDKSFKSPNGNPTINQYYLSYIGVT
ncbi:MAG: Arm DNA-binding domain-containing protein [Bacteroidales bacterium]|nr:Arm DNA-binding domain-containing protein [Bacteroidales bacterium]